MGIPVVVSDNGIPVRPVDDGAPVMTVADNGLGAPITISDDGAPFVVQGLGPPPWVPPGASFALDFANNRYWGGVPSLVRPSSALFDPEGGEWEAVGPNVLRRDSRGALLEPTRSNSVSNSALSGAVVGVVGSGGSLPDGWSMNSTPSGIVAEVVAIGGRAGLSAIDIRYVGQTSGQSLEVFLMPLPGSPATAADELTASSFIQVVGGSLDNVPTFHGVRVFGFTDDGSFISGTSGNFSGNVIVDGATRRIWKSGNLIGETVARSRMTTLGTVMAMNAPIDVTFRVSAPQLEFGDFPTSPIITEGAPVTRAADILSVSGLTGTHDLTIYLDDATEIQVPGWDAEDPIPLTGIDGRMVERIIGIPT